MLNVAKFESITAPKSCQSEFRWHPLIPCDALSNQDLVKQSRLGSVSHGLQRVDDVLNILLHNARIGQLGH